VRLKWPNDLWLAGGEGSGRKLGGVLIETLPLPPAECGGRGRYAVVGIGLNLDAPSARPGLDQPGAGWRELEPQARAPELLARVAAPLLSALAAFEARGFAAFASRFAARDALAGRMLRTTDPEVPGGRADGVDADGALRLLTAEGLQRVRSGEVSVRPC
jgi:BirA family biotin operon repressor/biotin-[acetyl-CoA-carboxylase] ligase